MKKPIDASRGGRRLSRLVALLTAIAGTASTALAEGTDRDAWDVRQGVVVTADSGTIGGSSSRDIFGATQSSVESGATLFRDDQAQGFIHFVEWRTTAPVSVDGFSLRANDDFNPEGDRGFSEFRLLAKNAGTGQFELIYTFTPARNPYGDHITVTDAFAAVVAQDFRAEFVQAAPAGRPGGPRIQELDAPTPAVSVDGYLLPFKASAKANAKSPSKSRLLVSGILDTGAIAPAFGTATTLDAGGLQVMTAGLTPVKTSFQLAAQGFTFTVTPSKFGSSRAKFKLAYVGDLGANVDPEGPLALSFANTAATLSGTPVLDRGAFDLRRGGELLSPLCTLVRAKAKLAGPGKDALSVVTAFTLDDSAPTLPFTVRLEFGDGFDVTLPASAFRRSGSAFLLAKPTNGVTSAKLDFRSGLMSFAAKGLDLGAYAEGPNSVRIAISLGADRRAVTVRMAKSGTSLRY